MQQIQEKVINNYHENIAFFQEKHPILHNKLLALDTIINNGSYKQKYDLEYKDDYFDVIELETNQYLYQQNSQKYSDEILQNISYKKDDQVFESFRNFKFDKNVLEFLKDASVYENFSTTADIINYYHNNTDKSANMLEIDKYIFLGTGLGIHIEKIINKFDLQVVLIIEDNIELFRLSLFTCNYKDVLQNRDSFFAIAQNRQEFHKTFHTFYTKAFPKNQYIKFSIFSSYYEDKIKQIQSLLITRPESTYSHERLLLKSKRVLDKVSKKYKFLDVQKKDKETFFTNKPILVIGAGPSLHKNLAWLQEHADKFIIIAALASLKTLKKIDVSPDIVTQIDEHDTITGGMLENLGDLAFIKNALFMFSASVPEVMFELFDKEKIYLHEDRTQYRLSKSTIVVASVGETMYSLALAFNAAKIYLLGLDLALDEKGSTHSPDHFKATQIEKNEDNDNNDFQLDTSIIKVKGNFRNEVETTPLLGMSIPVINIKTSQLKSDNQTIYNLNDGAYFDNVIPLHADQVQVTTTIDKTSLYNDLQKLFDNYSMIDLCEYEEIAMNRRKANINEYKDIVKTFKEAPYANKDVFLQSYKNLMNSMLANQNEYELKEIITVFHLRIASYIMDFFNTKALKESKKHTKKFKSMLVKQLNKMIDAYAVELEKIKL